MPNSRSTLEIFVFATATFFQTAVAPDTQTIHVGMKGSFYEPQVIFAEVNDTVVFEFDGFAHSVIQGHPENPCFPLEGGFSSGVVQGPNATSPIPSTWNLIITNPDVIWLYCGLNIPVSHCASGMVGAINPPSIDAFNQYSASAKLVTAAVPPTITVALTGQSAFATAPPGIPTTFVPASVTSTSTSTSSSITPPPTNIPTPTEEPTVNHKNLGGIIGGSVAGGVVLFAIVTYIIWVLLHRRRNRTLRGSQDFFNYQARNPPYSNVPADNSTPFVTSKDNVSQSLMTSTTQSTPVSTPPATSSFIPSRPYNNNTPRVTGANPSRSRTKAPPPSSPPRPPLPPIPGTPQRAEQQPPPPTVMAGSGTAEDGPDIRALAREVVVMLSQGQLHGARNAPRNSFSHNRRESPEPPGYGAVAPA